MYKKALAKRTLYLFTSKTISYLKLNLPWTSLYIRWPTSRCCCCWLADRCGEFRCVRSRCISLIPVLVQLPVPTCRPARRSVFLFTVSVSVGLKTHIHFLSVRFAFAKKKKKSIIFPIIRKEMLMCANEESIYQMPYGHFYLCAQYTDRFSNRPDCSAMLRTFP